MIPKIALCFRNTYTHVFLSLILLSRIIQIDRSMKSIVTAAISPFSNVNHIFTR